MKQTDVLLIGGGASGLLAAAKLSHHCRVILCDGNVKLGKKLLATGNGRCNLTNLSILPAHYHGDAQAAQVLEKFPAERILSEFAELGLLCRADSEGRVYPRSLQAAAVLQALTTACSDTAEIFCETQITRIKRQGDGFLAVSQGGEQFAAKKVILCCGGAASPSHSTGSGYELAKQLGHSVTPLAPSLCAVKVSGKTPKALKGMRCKANATLLLNGNEHYAESGEVMFGDGQLSGICIFNLSARLRDCPAARCEIVLDLAEDMSEDELFAYFCELCTRFPRTPAKELCAGLLNLRVGQELLKPLGLSAERTLATLSEQELRKAAHSVKHWHFTVTEPADFRAAQVTAGGVPLDEITLATMESNRCKGLYLVGELLNVDGDCGGYNLHWAWSTALLAADAVKEALSC